ncbi:MAG: propionate--CoA ligase [Candidatus Competibacteraceae bacterium]|uniref:Propionate--CoA ligase n=1 Tax=Candidatus Contendobacter odensis Run_B_J11 TaxID=1400861 RepID=A0A7U7GFG3_9GAMM|nr:propionate--CoA ligase [Candidatus Contendobacter odensis]MBK8535022.1 propionate--CoA ligase [Candidatus Competibacteraceae bacterium]MBK8753336.1 propionate--CoA ligase [Candidatus Competibacteraceae bacterium]CDH47299.1 putative propionyl-CoA synthetase (prpE) [Candidatus Contendobacter odensis Run_B_J11]
MSSYEDFHRRSIEDPEGFWGEQAQMIHWHKPPQKVRDYSKPPFCKWFVGGETNLCYNAVDRHLAERANQPALIYISTETDEEKVYTFAELHREVNRFAAVLQSQGLQKGDRVIIYMPMIAEALFAVLACVRLGAVHSVVFGGFAAYNLAVRIDDAKPKLMITSDAGMRGGKAVPYKHLVDESCSLAKFPPEKVILINRGLVKDMAITEGRDLDYATLRAQHMDAEVPITWLESNEPSYILYTSGTTGIPKGVQRDTGGYAVALASTMKHLYAVNPGETMFATSDIGWVVGHSYIIYGQLINGSATILYEGLPTRPDAGIWWKIVQDYKVRSMFSSPTAIRVLKSQDPKYMRMYDISCLRYLFLAGEPLDEPTSRWITDSLQIPVIDHYWQTETGWPMLSYLPGVDLKPNRFGSPGFPVYGYDIKVISEGTGEEVPRGDKGVLVVVPPLPPGCLSTVWGDDKRFVQSYFSSFKEMLYTSSDWAVRDEDGYFFILGRTDDVINVAGHRLGTREIEEAIQAHSAVAEVAVIGVADSVKGQVPVGFCRLRDPTLLDEPGAEARLEKEVIGKVQELLGAVAKPHRVHFVNALPKTRSGKLLRRSIQALAEGRDPGDLSTLDDPNSLEEVRRAVGH